MVNWHARDPNSFCALRDDEPTETERWQQARSSTVRSCTDAAVVIEGGDLGIDAARRAATRIDIDALPDGLWLAPGFIDLQANGGGDVLFNDTLRRKALRYRPPIANSAPPARCRP
jgi:hypothetical protein